MDKHFLDNDIPCLTETQLKTNNDTLPIESALQRQYRMHFNTDVNIQKHCILLFESDVISIFTLRKQQFSNTPISITLIYRLPNLPLSVFIDFSRYLVGRNIEIFLEDFNTDGFEEVRN